MRFVVQVVSQFAADLRVEALFTILMNTAKAIFPLLAAVTLLSCAPPPSFVAPAPKPLVKPPPAVVTPAHREGVDTQCSYFYFLWGKTAELNGRYDEALDAYEKAVVCDGEAEQLIRNLTVLLARMGRKQQAIEWADKLAQAHPGDADISLFQADLYAALGERDKAIGLYQAVLAQRPQDPEALSRLGKQYLDTLDYAKARDCFERLVAVKPDSLPGHYYLAQLYRELKDNPKAVAAYQKALDIDWSAALAMEAADFYEGQKLDPQAIELYKKVMDAGEGQEDEAAIRLARLYLARKQTDQALALLRDLRSKAPDDPQLGLAVGRILIEQRNYPEAIRVFSGLLAHDENDMAVRAMLAMTYYDSGDRAQAKTVLKAVKIGQPGFDEALALLVKLYAEDKDYHAAVALIDKAIRGSQGHDQSYRFLLASTYEEQGRLSEAEQVLREAISLYPKAVEGHFNYGMFLERHGRLDEAMTQMEKVLALNPDDPLALNYIGYSWADQSLRLPEALSYIQKALAQRPDDGFVLDSLGWVYFKMGKLNKAAEALEKATNLEPDDPTIHEHLGDVYRAAHKADLAVDNYRRSLEFSRKAADKARVKAKLDALGR